MTSTPVLRRAFLVEETGRGPLAVQDQLDRLKLYDVSGEHLTRWDAPAQLHVRSEPTGARVVPAALRSAGADAGVVSDRTAAG